MNGLEYAAYVEYTSAMESIGLQAINGYVAIMFVITIAYIFVRYYQHLETMRNPEAYYKHKEKMRDLWVNRKRRPL